MLDSINSGMRIEERKDGGGSPNFDMQSPTLLDFPLVDAVSNTDEQKSPGKMEIKIQGESELEASDSEFV